MIGPNHGNGHMTSDKYLLLPENEGYIAEYHPEQRSCEGWYEERYFPSTRVIIDLSQSFRNFFFRFTKRNSAPWIASCSRHQEVVHIP